MPDVTRIIEQKATESIYNDDWAIIDRPTEGEDGGTRKILVSKLKELLCGDYIADEWESLVTYNYGRFVTHEGKLYYNNSGGALVQITFNSNAWLEVRIDELLEKLIGSIGEKWRRVDTYRYDDLVVYGGRLYRCIKTASTQGTWVSNEWIEANAEYYFKKVREYIARYGFVPRREAISSPYNKGDLILYRAPGDTTNSLYMRLNDTEHGDPTWIPENWLKVGNIGGALSKIYDDMEESSCDVQIKEQSIVDENNVADLTSLAAVGSVSGAIATFDDGSDLPMPSLKVSIEPVQSGRGEPSPTNIRPISGWDEVNVSVSGVNIWDEECEVGNINDGSGEDLPQDNVIRSKGYIRVMSGNSYYIKCPTSGISRLFLYTKDKSYITYVPIDNITNNTYTIPNNCEYIRFRTLAAYGTTYNNDISINYPSTDTSYHAYNGTTYTIDLDGTRYGGTLDVVNGVLTVDRAYADLGDLTWNTLASGRHSAFISDGKFALTNTDIANALSSQYKITSAANLPNIDSSFCYGANGVANLLINDSRYNGEDATAFKTHMNGVQLVYELATPLTIQLTPTQVKSLLGVNNIWADTGNVLDAEYIRDMTTIINSLIARIEALENQ